MANGKCFPMIRGRVMRATALDSCGAVKQQACSYIVTDGFVSVALTARISQSDDIVVTNAGGKNCVDEPGTPTHNGYDVQITFCNVAPQLYAMMTNQAVVLDANDVPVGFRANSSVDPNGAGFALEVWSDIAGQACASGSQSYGYTLLPFIKGGVIGDFTIENGAVTFSLTNAITKDGNAWDVGPYNVVADASSQPSPLLTALDVNDFLHVQLTTIAPPTASCDCVASGPAPTGATSGTPGTFTPSGSYPPADYATLVSDAIVASPTSAWSTGEYVVLGDSSNAYWDGTAWQVGIAP